jgi:hypothetical protein
MKIMLKIATISNSVVLLIGNKYTWYLGIRWVDGVWSSARGERWPASGRDYPSIFIFGDET